MSRDGGVAESGVLVCERDCPVHDELACGGKADELVCELDGAFCEELVCRRDGVSCENNGGGRTDALNCGRELVETGSTLGQLGLGGLSEDCEDSSSSVERKLVMARGLFLAPFPIDDDRESGQLCFL